jgi:branched-chain amino acid transport system permease protein
LMFILIEAAAGVSSAYLFFVGLALVILVLFAPKGILGSLRERGLRWLP